MDHSDKVKRKANPRESANFFSLLTFIYTRKLFTSGFKKDLEDDDLYEVVRSCKSKKCADKLEHAYKSQEHKPDSTTFNVLWNTYGIRYFTLGLIHLSWRLTESVLEPEAISKLVAYFKPGQTQMTQNDAFFYAAIMIGLKIMHCFYYQNYIIYLQQLAIQIRTSFCSLIYRKALKLSPKALVNISLGNIVTVISKDIHQFESAIWLFNDLWIAVVQAIVICYLIYLKIGWSCTVGVVIILLTVPIQSYVGTLIKGMRLKINKRTDMRLQKTQEALSTIRIIKMYTWESIFSDKISEARKKEMKLMLRSAYSKIAMIVSSMMFAKIGFYALIMTYIWINTEVSAETMFYLMRSFGTLRHSVAIAVSMGFSRIAELTASLSRIDTILKEEELPESVDKPDDEPQVELRNISVTLKDKTILKNIDLKLIAGLTIVTGQLGGGKSSLIKVILKDYPIDEGELRTRGRKSYASQDPWLFPSSIKQNILFGEKYDYERYQKVVKVCALEYDFSILEKGDETIVADRGLNLSKGQQARVNLARAVYRDSDIYLIDDALTALDSRVQEQIFDECIRGFLKDKLVVLVTHNTKHIENADKVVILEHGAVKFEGKQQELSKNILEAIEDEVIAKSTNDGDESDDDEKTKLLKPAPKPKKIQVYHEVKKEGGVGLEIYSNYFKFGGGFFFFIIIIVTFFVTTLSESSSNKVLTNWINEQSMITNFKDQNIRNSTILANPTSANNSSVNDSILELEKLEMDSSKTLNLYSMLIISSALLELVKNYFILKFAVNASVNVHKRMLKNIVYSVMSFFDNYFIGNILNRFSQDLNVIDEHLPFVLSMLVGTLFYLGGVLGLIATVNWKFMFPSAALILCLIVLRFLYIPTARSLKRLEAATRSPLVGHLNSSIEGLTTIRAYKAQNILRDEFDKHQDLYTSANYTSLCVKRAFAFYMDICSVAFLAAIIARFLFFDSGTMAGDVGLTITQAGGLAAIVQVSLMQWSETENHMTSVERVLEYTHLEPETTSGDEVADWPNKGEINYVNVSLSYTNSHEKVLKNINFRVKSKQKIGIVGRTGAGKSSIISTLFRLYDYDGQIFIDDVEIKSLKLSFLRQHISIIPQDPIMFAGTVRSNIDPLNKYTDEEIWKTLHKIQLDNAVPSLDFEMEEGNFSTGQRQLICLARAIVQKNKIVVLDEATANMDPETEFLIQKTIVENFSACTVFIIAHRLQSILDCHKVMVLDKGEIMEYDDPFVLLENKKSLFAQMLKNAGIEDAQPAGTKK